MGRICYLLRKYYKEQGLNNLEIRQNIFDWASKHGVFFSFSVNNLIYQVMEDNTKLRGEIPIYITQQDIDEINARFDKKTCKYVALAVLCYAKATANTDKEVVVSTAGFAHWLGMQQQNISTRYLPELCDFKYIEKIDDEEIYFSWDKSKPLSKNRRYKVKVTLENKPERAIYELRNNDINALCRVAFKKK